MYPAADKRTPRHATGLGDKGELAPYDVLYFMASTAGAGTRTAEVALHALLTMDRGVLTGAAGGAGEEEDEEDGGWEGKAAGGEEGEEEEGGGGGGSGHLSADEL